MFNDEYINRRLKNVLLLEIFFLHDNNKWFLETPHLYKGEIRAPLHKGVILQMVVFTCAIRMLIFK
jgi:hypothetical protein